MREMKWQESQPASMDPQIESVQSSTLELNSTATSQVASRLYSTDFYVNTKSVIEFSSQISSSLCYSHHSSITEIALPSSTIHDISPTASSSSQLWPSSSHVFNVTTTTHPLITTPETVPKQNNLVYYVGIPVGVVCVFVLILILVRKCDLFLTKQFLIVCTSWFCISLFNSWFWKISWLLYSLLFGCPTSISVYQGGNGKCEVYQPPFPSNLYLHTVCYRGVSSYWTPAY